MFGGTQLVVLLGFRSMSASSGVAAMLTSCVVVALLTLVVARFPRERAAGLVMR